MGNPILLNPRLVNSRANKALFRLQAKLGIEVVALIFFIFMVVFCIVFIKLFGPAAWYFAPVILILFFAYPLLVTKSKVLNIEKQIVCNLASGRSLKLHIEEELPKPKEGLIPLCEAATEIGYRTVRLESPLLAFLKYDDKLAKLWVSKIQKDLVRDFPGVKVEFVPGKLSDWLLKPVYFISTPFYLRKFFGLPYLVHRLADSGFFMFQPLSKFFNGREKFERKDKIWNRLRFKFLCLEFGYIYIRL